MMGRVWMQEKLTNNFKNSMLVIKWLREGKGTMEPSPSDDGACSHGKPLWDWVKLS